MLSPIRQRDLARRLKHSADRLEEISRSQPSYDPRGIITPPYVPVPLSVPAVTVEPIDMNELSIGPTTTHTKHTGEIDTMSNITAITQEDNKQTDVQVEEEEEKEYSLDEVQRIKNQIREKILEYYNKHDQTFPQTMRISAHNLLPLATAGLIETIFKLRDLPTTVVADPTIGDDIQCCDG